jgi:hypothetical protein
MLEDQMQELRGLPARVAGVELQIVQLRGEMREAFSATRSELRGEMHGIRDELLAEIRGGDQATQNFMKVLFEHHQSNLRTIGEGAPRKGRKR